MQFLSTLVGLIYFREDYDQAGAASIAGGIFWMVMNNTFSNYTSMLSVRGENNSIRDRSNFREIHLRSFVESFPSS